MRHRLLLVDNERPILLAVGEYFRRHGYEVDCAQRQDEAEALLATVAYACVISDLRLSARGKDGLDLASFARERCPRTRFVVLTAHGCPAAEQEALRLGVDAFLHKPRPLAQVAGIVEDLIGDTR